MLNRCWLLGVVLGIALPATAFAQFPGGGGGPGGGRRTMMGDPMIFFNMLSKGKDVIVREELDDGQKMMFDRMAQRMNISGGQITRDQYSESVKQRGLGGGTGGGSGGNAPDQAQIDKWADARFDSLDKDKDGMLSADEIAVDDALLAEKEKWDTDGNGLISRTEFRAYFAARIIARQQERDAAAKSESEVEVRKPAVYKAGKLPPDLPAWFTQLDTDGDLQVGLYEWRKSGRSINEFKEYDRNGDGLITIEEVLLVVRLQARSKGDGQTPTMASTGGMPGFPGRNGVGGPSMTPFGAPRSDSNGTPGMGWPNRGAFPGGSNGGPMMPGGDRMRGFRGGPGGFQRGFQPPGGSDQADSPNGSRSRGGRPRGNGE